jgi:hypothetical protein
VVTRASPTLSLLSDFPLDISRSDVIEIVVHPYPVRMTASPAFRGVEISMNSGLVSSRICGLFDLAPV